MKPPTRESARPAGRPGIVAGLAPRERPALPRGLIFTVVAALLYCLWVGAHWLPLPWSDKEFAASAARVWAVQQSFASGHGPSWWTPWFMSGSSEALHYARGFYLLPWLALQSVASLAVAGKLMLLGAMFLGTLAMYAAARYLLRSPPGRADDPRADPVRLDWGAALAALAYLLEPEQLTRAVGQEHVTISLSLMIVPLLWLTAARVLDTGRARDAIFSGLTGALALAIDNKQAFVQCLFLLLYGAVHGVVAARQGPAGRARLNRSLRGAAGAAAVMLGTAAVVLVPGLVESRYVKLFRDEPIENWQRMYSFKSLMALVDRDAVLTRTTWQSVQRGLEAGTLRATSEAQAAQLRGWIQRIAALPMDAPEKYAGLVLLLLVAIAVLSNQPRRSGWRFWFWVAAWLVGINLATGLSSPWAANRETMQALFGLPLVPAAVRAALVVAGLALVLALALVARRKLRTVRGWWLVALGLVAFLFVPAFGWLAGLPYFADIRAPGVFYSLPATFFLALLAGAFVTDALAAPRWRRWVPFAVPGLVLLLLADYWSGQKPLKDNGVPARTLANLRASYGSLRADPDWVKTYSISGRYFHLLGPMYGGKPQVYEAFYNWMCPLGTGLLNQQAFSSWNNHRAFLDLLAARYVVFDKTDPGNAQQPRLQQILGAYRQTFPVTVENEDFVVFRNAAAHSYLAAYGRACLFVGDVRASAPLALELAARGFPLVQSETGLAKVPPVRLRQFERIYVTGDNLGALSRLPDNVQARISIVGPGAVPPLPLTAGALVTLGGVQLEREHNDLIRGTASAPGDCLAVVAESYYPFWHAEVDGQPVPLRQVSGALMGLDLPAGKHAITLRYRPPVTYTIAGIVSALSLLGCVTGLMWERRRAVRTGVVQKL